MKELPLSRKPIELRGLDDHAVPSLATPQMSGHFYRVLSPHPSHSKTIFVTLRRLPKFFNFAVDEFATRR